ncbi:MAG: hypothetical protein JO199_11385 [Candidatus Eremiobacteraeota bacterium]|nr:hypothetical protein [Candidatus Eremiobacteraeota bacterium]
MNAAALGFAGVFVFVYFLFIIGIVALTIWFWWRIFAKAGFSGALALLNLLFPVGNLVCILILAFGRWPIEDQLAAARGLPSGVPPGGMPPPAPGSTLAT